MAERGIGSEDAENQPSWSFKGKNYLLAIGINKYQHWNPLNNAVRDVHDFVEVLKQSYQFDDSNITCLLDEDAHEDKILHHLEELVDVVSEKDNLIIYYSGHGHYNEKLSEGYWVPVDAKKDSPSSYISNSTLVQYLKSIKSHHTFLIVDSCFSGSLITQMRSGVRSEAFPSRRVFTSGRKEVVEDGKPGANSPFATGILSFLKRNNDRTIKTTTLIEFVKDYMERQGTNQIPDDSRIRDMGDQGGELVFYLRKNEEEIWSQLKAEGKLSSFEKYLEYYPDGKYAEEAREQVHEMKEDDVWENTKRRNRYEAYRKYLEDYPRGKYRNEAFASISRLEELTFWDTVSEKDTLSGYLEYLAKYPNGKYAVQADKRRGELEGQLMETEKEAEDRRLHFEKTKQKERENALREGDFRKAVEDAEQFFAAKDFASAKLKYQVCIANYREGFEPDLQFLNGRLAESSKFEEFVKLYNDGKAEYDKGNYSLALHFFQKAAKIHRNQKLTDIIQLSEQKMKGGQWSAPRPAPQPEKKSSAGMIIGVLAAIAFIVVIAVITINSDNSYTPSDPGSSITVTDPNNPVFNNSTDDASSGRTQDIRQTNPSGTEIYDNLTYGSNYTNQILGTWKYSSAYADNEIMNVATQLFAADFIGTIYTFNADGSCLVNGVALPYSVSGSTMYLNGNLAYIEKMDGSTMTWRTPKSESGVNYNVYEVFEKVNY